MKTYNLDTIQKVPLREVWPHEAHDFTKWLAEEQNLATLGMAVGIELELIETESSVGSFNVDIYAQESGTGRKVIIENQLEDTNHDHLGKVITYAAGKGAEVVIWVVAHARDEHRQAIEWLNQHTDSDFGFFLVEVELWKIGDSLPAPRFGVVEQPNEWTKTVKLSEGLSETEKVKLAYWTAYREVAGGHPEFLKEFSPQKPSKDHWSTLRLGVSAYHLALLIDTHKGRTGIELYVDDDKEIGHRAIANSWVFEEHLGLTAAPFDAKKASGLRFYKAGHPIKGHQDAWPGYIEEQLGWALEMKKNNRGDRALKKPRQFSHVTGARCSAPPGRSTQTTRDVLRKRPRPWIKPRAWALHFIPSRFIPSPSTRQARSQRLPGGRCERWAHEESAGYRAPFRTSGRQQDTVRAQPCRHLSPLDRSQRRSRRRRAPRFRARLCSSPFPSSR